MQGRVQSAIQPLQREITNLRDELRRVEGRLENLQGLGQPQLKVGFLKDGVIVKKAVLKYIPSRAAGLKELERQREVNKFEGLLDEIRADKRKDDEPTSGYRSQLGSISYLHPIKLRDEEVTRLRQAKNFLNEWGYSVSDEDITFDKAWVGKYGGQSHNLGPDAKRVENVSSFLSSIEQVQFLVKEACRVGTFIPLDLYIGNSPGIAAKAVHVMLTVLDSQAINLYQPEFGD